MSDREQAKSDDFAPRAPGAPPGLVGEFWGFLMANKRWWLAPIVVSILGLILLAFLGGTTAAPFVYTLF